MIGDPILVSLNDYERGKEVLKNLNKNKIILIGGGSGTRKSELAYAVQKLLNDKGKSSFVISLDDYYLVHATIRAENRKKQGLDSVGIMEIEWETLKRIYRDFILHKPIHFKRTHRFLNNIEFNTIESNEIDYIIIEGLYANYLRKKFTDNFSVYLEGNPSQTLAFRKLRGKENEQDAFREKVVQKEYKVVAQMKKYADLVLSFVPHTLDKC